MNLGVAALVGLVLLGDAAPAKASAASADPAPATSPTPASRPAIDPAARPLRRAVEALADPTRPLPGDPCRELGIAGDKPCFPAAVERQQLTPEENLARFFGGFDARHGPTGKSAPSDREMLEVMREHVRPRGSPETADLLGMAVALAGLLKSKLGGPEPERYFLYLAQGRGRAWLALREGRLPPEIEFADPAVRYALVAGFPKRAQAQAAYERLEDALAEIARRERAGQALEVRP